MSLLRVEHLAVTHGPLQALWDVDFSVDEGARAGLLGANGAGKSTTLGAIAGVYPSMGGRILFENDDIGRLSVAERVARGIVLAPEGRRLFPTMTVRENLDMGAFLAAARRERMRSLDRVFEIFPALEARQSQAAGTLSGGQQQMLVIGRALMSRPRLLMLDEPFIGVAPLIVRDVMAALARIAGEGVTILLVEQNIHRAFEFVSRASVIENGRTVLEGATAELSADAGFNAKFLGLE